MTQEITPDWEKGPQASTSVATRGEPLTLPWLAASLILIAFAAVVLVSLFAILVLLVLYAKVGREGLSELYSDLRFEPVLKTEVGAVVVGVFYTSITATTIGAARLRGGRDWQRLVAWLPIGGRWSAILLLAAAILAYAAVTTLLLTHSQHRYGVLDAGPTDYVLLGTFVANLVVMAPCAEEIFFRGWLFTNMRQRLSFWPSFLTTAGLFAAIHWDAHQPRVLLITPLALALGYLREMTGSIKPTIALHVTYNLIIVAVRLLEL